MNVYISQYHNDSDIIYYISEHSEHQCIQKQAYGTW